MGVTCMKSDDGKVFKLWDRSRNNLRNAWRRIHPYTAVTGTESLEQLLQVHRDMVSQQQDFCLTRSAASSVALAQLFHFA